MRNKSTEHRDRYLSHPTTPAAVQAPERRELFLTQNLEVPTFCLNFAGEMSKRREKNKPHQPQQRPAHGDAPLVKSKLEAVERESEKDNEQARRTYRLRTFMYELGKFLVDIAKLVFAGVILAGIMDEGIDRKILFMTGSAVVVSFALTGLVIISKNKES